MDRPPHDVGARRRPVLGFLACVFCVGLGGLARPATAQDVDSLAAAMMARADSLRASRADSLRASRAAVREEGDPTLPRRRPHLVDATRTWRSLASRRPVTAGAGDFGDLLVRVPGSFLHDFGPDGWPDAWSPDGLDPADVSLRLDAIPFDDPVTGVPAWDLLPAGPLAGLEWSPMDRSGPYAVRAVLPDSARQEPMTEMRYRSGSGLQAVDVTHAQRRPVSVFGTRTALDLELGYAGAGSAGEYEGSRLRRKRQLFLRVSSVLAGWDLSAMILTNRHRVGAHAGVIPPGSAYESVYDRLLAGVEHADAVRERYRSDVALGAGRAVLGRPLSVTAYRTQHLLRYVRSGDSTATRVVRYGAEASMPLLEDSWPLVASVSMSRDAYPDSSALGSGLEARGRLEASLRGSRTLGPLSLDYAGGLQRADGTLGASARAGARVAVGRLGFDAHVTSAPLLPSAADLNGLGATAIGLVTANPDVQPSDAAGRSERAVAGATLDAGAVGIDLRAFAVRRSGGVLWIGTDTSGGAKALLAGSDLVVRGIVLSLSLRDRASRGFHAQASGTLPLATGGVGELADAWSGALPDVFGRAEVGWRGSLFQGDAVVDLRAEARTWATMRGRQPATATGQSVLAYAGSRDVPASTIVDLKADVVVRGATLFLSLENLLSGTGLVPGNQLVADYPYPERRWRFGVFWPIPD